MLLIKSTSRRDVIRRFNKAKADYESKRSAYNAQEAAYDAAIDAFNSAFLNKVRSAIGAGLLNIFGDNLKISIDRKYNYHTSTYSYIINFRYSSGRSDVYYTSNGRYGYKGVPFQLSIFVDTESTDNAVIHSPILDSVDALRPEDYEMLQSEIQFFKVIDTIDWGTILKEAEAATPDSSDYITMEKPQPVDSAAYARERASAIISKIIGKDLWLSVDIDRGPNFDSERYDYGDVIGRGYARFIKETSAYYFFNWVEHRLATSGDLNAYAQSRMLTRQIKLKKAYFTVPDKPKYLSTDDIIDIIDEA